MTAPRAGRDRPKVTVITPTADRLTLLKESVLSILRQSMGSWELIVVDDASTDGTAEWLDALTDPRIRVVRFEARSERCAARNRAAEIAAGRYVLHLDDDDRLRPRALERLSAVLDGDPGSVAAAGRVLDLGRAADGGPPRARRRRGDLLVEALCALVVLPSGSVLYRASALASAGPQDERFLAMEDIELSLRVLALGPATLVPEIVVEHRVGPSLYRPDEPEFQRMWELARREALDRLHPERRREVEGALLSWQAVMRAHASPGADALPILARELRRVPRFWLGGGRRLALRVLGRSLRGLRPGNPPSETGPVGSRR